MSTQGAFGAFFVSTGSEVSRLMNGVVRGAGDKKGHRNWSKNLLG